MGEIAEFIEAALNHKHIRSPLASVYNRSRYFPEVRRALAKLANYLSELAGEYQEEELAQPN